MHACIHRRNISVASQIHLHALQQLHYSASTSNLALWILAASMMNKTCHATCNGHALKGVSIRAGKMLSRFMICTHYTHAPTSCYCYVNNSRVVMVLSVYDDPSQTCSITKGIIVNRYVVCGLVRAGRPGSRLCQGLAVRLFSFAPFANLWQSGRASSSPPRLTGYQPS